MEAPKEVYNPFADPNELYSAVRTLPPASGPSGSTARPDPEHNTAYLRPTSITQPDLGSALDLRERHVGGTGGGSAGGAGPGASGAGGLGLGVAGVPGRSVTTGAAGIYAYDQSGDLGMGSPGFDRANDFARQPEHSAYGQEERKKLAFQSAYMWRLVGLLKAAQIILNLSFAVSSSIYLPCFYTTGGFIEATAWITFVLICFSFLVDAFGVVPLMWASWRVIEFVGSMVVAIWVLAAAIAAMVFVMEVVPGAGFLIGSTIFGYFVAFIYVALGVLAILDHTHRLPRWA